MKNPGKTETLHWIAILSRYILLAGTLAYILIYMYLAIVRSSKFQLNRM